MCQQLGNVPADNLGIALKVNTKIELCGAFINHMKVTYVNYTSDNYNQAYPVKTDKRKYRFSLLDLGKIPGEHGQFR